MANSNFKDRIISLSQEIENFPLGNCSPSDDPDKQTAYLYSFRDLSTRFIASLKRINDNTLNSFLNDLTIPDDIYGAYELKSDLQSIIDYINDNNIELLIKNNALPDLSGDILIQLIKSISLDLSQESANNLPKICEAYGLASGTIEEAYKSKYNYIYSRITYLSISNLLILAKNIKGKYIDSQTDKLLSQIYQSENMSLISVFENIREIIIKELDNAQFCIWIAVAWFTDKDLANLLYKKVQKGINVQILLNDDKINEWSKVKFPEYFETYYSKGDKLMHNKFCVIDLCRVLHGSYNWTNKAQYNNETISIIENRYTSQEFAKEFIKIKNECIVSNSLRSTLKNF